MAPTDANVISGVAEARIKAFAAGNDPVTGNTVDWSGWLGHWHLPDDGVVELAYEGEWHESRSGHLLGKIKRRLVGHALTVKIPILETSLDVLQYGIPAATYTVAATPGTDPNKLGIGELATIPEWSVGLEGIAGTGNELILFIPKASLAGPATLQFSKRDDRVFELVLEAFNDPAQSAGEELAVIYEITDA